MTSNLLTNHLHQQRDRIAGMLTPGAKIAPGQRPLSPLLPGFGGQKFKLAARKMRALDPAQLGYLRPENILQPLIGPINEARNLLHLKPAEQDASTPWSQVETVFPSAAEPEAPPLPGELRQGSIIPRMALTPQPGQSLESFKEQIAQRPKTPPSPAESQKPRIAPKSRLFSHIEEIVAPKTAGELPGGPPEEEIIQRQAGFKREPAPGLPQKPVDVEKAIPQEEPISTPAPLIEPKIARAEEPPSQPPVPQPESTPKAAAPTPEGETAPLPRAVPVSPQKPAPTEQILPRAAPAQKQPQAAALPVAPPPTQKPVVQAKPPEQKAAPPSKPKARSPQAAASQPASTVAPPAPSHPEPAPHPAPDLPVPVEEPTEPQLFAPPVLPETAQPTLETGAMAVSEPETPPSEEMPLRKQVTYRKQSPAKLKTLTPQQVKPKIETPALARPEKPLIPPQKYHPAAPAVVARQPDERPLSDLLPAAQTRKVLNKPQPATTPQAQRAEPESAQPTSAPSTGPVPMALAYPPRWSEQVEQTPPVPPSPPAASEVAKPVETAPQKNAQQSRETPSPLAARPASIQNVVQRSKWPENEGGPSSGTVGSGQGSDASGAGQAQTSLDLAQLAEDVFPYVKRLIEIESDRISSRFR